MLYQLVLLALALQAYSSAVLVTFTDSTCTNSYALFPISVDGQCQVIHNIVAYNIDTVAAGCSIYLFDDIICTSNERLAPAVGTCIKASTSSDSSLKVICSGASAGTSALRASSTAATSSTTASLTALPAVGSPSSTSSSTGTSSSSSSSGGGGLSKPAQIALATVLPLAALIAVAVYGFRTWAKYRRGGYAPPTPIDDSSRARAYSWNKSQLTSATTEAKQETETVYRGAGASSNRWQQQQQREELPMREHADPRELGGSRDTAEMP